ncbi:class I SAM-dependent methyltransferase [Streptomyces phaeochromogenes]
MSGAFPTPRAIGSSSPSTGSTCPTSGSERRSGFARAIHGVAEALPFDDDSVDAAMAMVTLHQWPDAVAGRREMRRVVRGPVVVLTVDGDELGRLWLRDYVRELRRAEAGRSPAIKTITHALGPGPPMPTPCSSRSTAATGSPRRSTPDPSPTSTRPYGVPSPPGRSSNPASRNAR